MSLKINQSSTYPYGMIMPGRSYTSQSYRYGFNGQLKDDEVAGSGNSYTALFWQYDSRLGRRWNLDPKPNLSISQYATFAGNPILYSDPLGDTVRYEKGLKGLQERINVFAAKISSKEFREEFETLQSSENVYTFRNYGKEDGISNVGVDDINYDEDGNIKNYEFSINYTTKSKYTAAPYGQSPLHSLFEESFHATDFETGLSNMQVLDNSNELGWHTKSGQIAGETQAWKFAANNAPFTKNSGYFRKSWSGTEYRAYSSETIIGRINKAQNDSDISRILFSKQKFDLNVPYSNIKNPQIIVGPIY